MKHLSNNNFDDNQLNNVPDGVNDNQAVNVSQLNTKASREDILWFDRLLPTPGGFELTLTGGIQGVAYDGTYYYVTTSSHLYKYNTSGTLITSRSNASDGNTHKYLGDLVVRNGKLYVSSANFSGPPPFSSYVVEFNASNLTYVTEYLVSSSERCDTVTFNNGSFWLPTYERNVMQYNESWELVATYPMNIGSWTYDNSTYGYGFDGATWIGNNLILNVHAGVYPNCMYTLYFNGTHFMRSGQPARPTYTTQGIDYNPETNKIIAAERGPTAKITMLNLRTDPPSITEWKEIGRTTLTAASSAISVTNLPDYRYVNIRATLLPSGGTINAALRFNNDSGNNYSRMRSADYGAGSPGTEMNSIGTTTTDSDMQLIDAQLVCVAGQPKAVKAETWQTRTPNNTTPPRAVNVIGKWTNLTNAVNRIDVVNTAGSGLYASGSEVIVYGHD